MAALNAEQSQRLLEEIRHTRIYWPVLIALVTGMRRGEIMALRWCNVDLERGIIRHLDDDVAIDAVTFELTPEPNGSWHVRNWQPTFGAARLDAQISRLALSEGPVTS